MFDKSKKGKQFTPLDEEPFLKRLIIYIAALFMALFLTIGQSVVVFTGQYEVSISILIFLIVIFVYYCFGWILLSLWKSTTDYAHSKVFKGNFTKNAITNLLLALLVSLIFHFIIMILPINKVSNDVELNVYLLVVLFVFQVLVAPFIEEVVVRGLFLSMFFKKKLNIFNFSIKQEIVLRLTFAILISAFTSTILHGMSAPISVLSLLLNGVLCAILYISSKHILTPILFHMINNLFAWSGLLLILIK